MAPDVVILTNSTWQFHFSTLNFTKQSNILIIVLPLMHPSFWNDLFDNRCNATSIVSFGKKLRIYKFAIAYLPE